MNIFLILPHQLFDKKYLPKNFKFVIWEHPQYLDSDFLQHKTASDGKEYTYTGPLWCINGERPQVDVPAPVIGEHNREVLGILTSLSEEQITSVSS